ncbi:hypothetical protein Tco_0649507 [Tanacetum coccineum]
MATNEETNAAGTDTRPPMLVESDYESWKIRIHSTDLASCCPAPRKKLDSESILFKDRKDYSTKDEDLFDEYGTLSCYYYTHLKSLEPHATKTLKKQEAVYKYLDHWPMHFSTNQQPAQDSPISRTPVYGCKMSTLLLEPIAEESSRRERMDSQYFKDKCFTRRKRKEKGMPQRRFRFSLQFVIHYCKPHQVNEYNSNDNPIFAKVDNHLESGDAPGRTFNSDAETEIDDNTSRSSLVSS